MNAAADFDRFSEWFDVLAVTHRLHGVSELREQMKAEYFDVLRSYPIEAVESAYQTLRRKIKKWPVPADWLEALPPFGSAARLPVMTEAERQEIDEAERLGYEAKEVCACRDCLAANMAMPPRYVPRQTPAGDFIERRHPSNPNQGRLLGRWIHGRELRSWYTARAEFYTKLQALPKTAPEKRKGGFTSVHDIAGGSFQSEPTT